MPPLISVFIESVLGFVIGSFIAAFSYRYPIKISVAKGRSFCPNCKNPIKWYDNIPLISYLFLGGRCRHCKKHISLRYPVIELATAIGFVLVGMSIFWLIMFCILELIFIIDLEHQIIPDVFVFWGILITLLHILYLVPNNLFPSLFSGFLVATLLMSIHIATKGRGMGLGDVKFAVLGGLLVGLNISLIWLFLAFLTGGIVGIILILGHWAGLKDKIAFGPFLVAAIPITLICGEKIISFLLLR